MCRCSWPSRAGEPPPASASSATRLAAERPVGDRVEQERGPTCGDHRQARASAWAEHALVGFNRAHHLLGPLVRRYTVPTRSVHVASIHLVGGAQHVGGHSGSDQVHGVHTGSAQLAAQRFGEADDPRLRSGISARRGEVGIATDRCVVDDRSLPPGEHPREYAPREMDNPHQVHLEHRVYLVDRLLLQQSAGHQPGVVHEQVDLLQVIAKPCARSLDVRLRGEVDMHGTNLPGCTGRDAKCLEMLDIPYPCHYRSQGPLGESFDERATYAPVGSGNERDLACQVHTLRLGGCIGAARPLASTHSTCRPVSLRMACQNGLVSTVSEERTPRLTAVMREGERVTPLELFFDLVFVLALTQCTTLMARTPTWIGLLKGVLALGMLWWAWTGYAWLTSVVDPEEGSVRLVIFTAMAAMLVRALGGPGAVRRG